MIFNGVVLLVTWIWILRCEGYKASWNEKNSAVLPGTDRMEPIRPEVAIQHSKGSKKLRSEPQSPAIQFSPVHHFQQFPPVKNNIIQTTYLRQPAGVLRSSHTPSIAMQLSDNRPDLKIPYNGTQNANYRGKKVLIIEMNQAKSKMLHDQLAGNPLIGKPKALTLVRKNLSDAILKKPIETKAFVHGKQLGKVQKHPVPKTYVLLVTQSPKEETLHPVNCDLRQPDYQPSEFQQASEQIQKIRPYEFRRIAYEYQTQPTRGSCNSAESETLTSDQSFGSKGTLMQLNNPLLQRNLANPIPEQFIPEQQTQTFLPAISNYEARARCQPDSEENTYKLLSTYVEEISNPQDNLLGNNDAMQENVYYILDPNTHQEEEYDNMKFNVSRIWIVPGENEQMPTQIFQQSNKKADLPKLNERVKGSLIKIKPSQPLTSNYNQELPLPHNFKYYKNGYPTVILNEPRQLEIPNDISGSTENEIKDVYNMDTNVFASDTSKPIDYDKNEYVMDYTNNDAEEDENFQRALSSTNPLYQGRKPDNYADMYEQLNGKTKTTENLLDQLKSYLIANEEQLWNTDSVHSPRSKSDVYNNFTQFIYKMSYMK